MKQVSIPYMQLRGGSSKGIYLLASDLPCNELERNQMLLDIVGRDERQIDGLGGGDPLTSKVAIISKSNQPGVDIDFLFVQIVVGQNRVDTTPNCGNILAGVGYFAIEAGLLNISMPETRIKVNMLNTHKLCELVMQTPKGELNYHGNQRICGVPGTAAPIICNYLDVAGSVTGQLFPTGNLTDEVEGIKVTCVDNGMPIVLIRAKDLSLIGDEAPTELNANVELKTKLEKIRLAISPLMNIVNAIDKAVPKMCIISPAKHGGAINTRTFIPHFCHTAIGVLGAVSVATACVVEGTVAAEFVTCNISPNQAISIEHPSGDFDVNLDFIVSEKRPHFKSAGVIRTARLLSKGTLFIPSTEKFRTIL